MKLINTVAIFFLICPILFAQISDDPEKNWYKDTGRGDDYYTGYVFRGYTPADVEKAISRYGEISRENQNEREDKWAGSYRMENALGSSDLILNPRKGFVYAYIYHSLSNLDFGGIVITDSSIRFSSEKKSSLQSKRFEDEHVKVKFGERRLLVPRKNLKEFAEWAVGRDVSNSDASMEIFTDDGFYWENVEDSKKPIGEFPEFPAEYEHLRLKPIQASILAIGQVRKVTTKNESTGSSIEHWPTLTLSAGKKNGVRPGMTFWIDELNEEVQIVSVSSIRSIARLVRDIVEGEEYCLDDSQNQSKCQTPKNGMRVRTRQPDF